MPFQCIALVNAALLIVNPQLDDREVVRVVGQAFQAGEPTGYLKMHEPRVKLTETRGEPKLATWDDDWSFRGEVKFRVDEFHLAGVILRPRTTFTVKWHGYPTVERDGAVPRVDGFHFHQVGPDEDDLCEEAWKTVASDPMGTAIRVSQYYWSHGGYAIGWPRLIVWTSCLRRLGHIDAAVRMARKYISESGGYGYYSPWLERLRHECQIIAEIAPRAGRDLEADLEARVQEYR